MNRATCSWTRRHHRVGGVADAGHRDAGAEVDQRVAVDVDQHAAAGPLDEHRQRGADAAGHHRVAALHQRGRARAGDGGHQAAFLGQGGSTEISHGEHDTATESGVTVVGHDEIRSTAGPAQALLASAACDSRSTATPASGSTWTAARWSWTRAPTRPDVDLAGVADVLVTHEHADHLDVDRLVPLVRDGLRLHTNADFAASLATDHGLEVHAVAAGGDLHRRGGRGAGRRRRARRDLRRAAGLRQRRLRACRRLPPGRRAARARRRGRDAARAGQCAVAQAARGARLRAGGRAGPGRSRSTTRCSATSATPAWTGGWCRRAAPTTGGWPRGSPPSSASHRRGTQADRRARREPPLERGRSRPASAGCG